MELKECKKCGVLFGYDGSSELCDKCIEDKKTDLEKVKGYLYENKNANINEIHKNTGVKKKKILKFIENGSVAAVNNDDHFHCKRCGKIIETGVYCVSCYRKMNNKIKEKKDEVENKKKSMGMFAHEYNKKKKGR